MARREVIENEYKETVVAINRVSKTVKGGRVMKFSALVVVGDGKGKVGYGMGKAAEVPEAIRKGIEAAKKNMITVQLSGSTIPHDFIGESGTYIGVTAQMNTLTELKSGNVDFVVIDKTVYQLRA